MKYKEQNYKKLKKVAVETGELFQDPFFQTSNKSVFFSTTSVEIEWKRPGVSHLKL